MRISLPRAGEAVAEAASSESAGRLDVLRFGTRDAMSCVAVKRMKD